MSPVEAVFGLMAGLFLIRVAYRGHVEGVIGYNVGYFRSEQAERHVAPVRYWFHILLFGGGGVFATVSSAATLVTAALASVGVELR